ncbi:translation initiation factor IF-2-like [Sciurus carolinensis]|uniref:translation initiation factor IF-2-like n=1 Tax=Sciurus carolinensis TaxID=30640 RepID=UPI001FB45132|nr:translation initiation factor IF-2-like [Sciurus carolinensis]XP_047387069.1 translation initiation factor IF-2-like [Sciurus carolinensis]
MPEIAAVKRRPGPGDGQSQGSPAPSRVGGGADLSRLRRPGRGASRLPAHTGRAGGAALTCLWGGLWLRRRLERAGARLAGQAPARQRRRARCAAARLGPGSPARRAELNAEAPRTGGRQSSWCTLSEAAETAGTGPGMSRSPGGRRRRRRRGGATGSPTRSPGSSCGQGGLRTPRASSGLRLAGRRTRAGGVTVPGSSAPACLVRHREPLGWHGREEGRAGSAASGKAGPEPPVGRRPWAPGGRHNPDPGPGPICELIRVWAHGCTCPGRL